MEVQARAPNGDARAGEGNSGNANRAINDHRLQRNAVVITGGLADDVKEACGGWQSISNIASRTLDMARSICPSAPSGSARPIDVSPIS
jgi:hypothetical protein